MSFIPLDDWVIVKAVELANHYRVPIVFHIEPFFSPDGIDQLAKVKSFYMEWCETYPNATIIAAHNGMMPPEDLSEIFSACSNVMSDFKYLRNRKAQWRFFDLHAISGKDGVLDKRWLYVVRILWTWSYLN